MPFSVEEMNVLRAALDRVIPRDGFPSATEAGVDLYVERIFQRELAPAAQEFAAGLRALDAESRTIFSRPFDALTDLEKDRLLTSFERGVAQTRTDILPRAFFDRLVNLAAEGYYSDPGQGGNRDAIGWKMVGYDPRILGRTTGPG